MGANLIPVVRNFSITPQTFVASDCAVVEGCAVVGARKLLKFDFLCWNAGNADVHLGSPQQNPQWYVFSPCHGHYHLKHFNDYALYDCKGKQRTGLKQAFCLMDVEKRSSPAGTKKFTCSDQGVTAGWADVYGSGLDCQWIDITGIPEGEYGKGNRRALLPRGLPGDQPGQRAGQKRRWKLEGGGRQPLDDGFRLQTSQC